MAEGDKKRLVEKPLEIIKPMKDSSQAIIGKNVGGSSGASGLLSLLFKIPAINEKPIVYGSGRGIYDPYMVWLIDTLCDPDRNGIDDLENNILNVIRAIDKVNFPGDSPTLQKMTQSLKDMLYGYEFSLSFAIYKAIMDLFLASVNYMASLRNSELKSFYREVAKANAKQVLIDFGVATVDYFVTQLSLNHIRDIFIGYTIHGEGVEGALRRINEFFAYTTGLGKIIGYALAIGTILLLIVTHYKLLKRAYEKTGTRELEEKLKGVFK